MILLSLAACGGGDSSVDGNTAGDGGTDGAKPMQDAAKPTHHGFVDLQTYDAMNTPSTPTRGGQAIAAFFAMGDYCTTAQTIGSCSFLQCMNGFPTGVSAGTVTLTGAAQPITLMPNPDKTYTAVTSTTTPMFSGGENVTFAATGADVPAFSKSLVMPSRATITSPSKPAAAASLVVPRGQDYSVTWSGGGSGKVQVALFTLGTVPQRLICYFDASAGDGKVPTAALAMLSAGAGSFAMATTAFMEVDAGDWAVQLGGFFNAVWPDAAIVSGSAMFQ